jgi:hypothetical protein
MLTALRWSFCAFIAWASAQAFLAAWSDSGEAHLGAHAHLLLAAVEFCAALALLAPRLAKAAAVVLCSVCTIAAGVSLTSREAPLRFVYYAATAVLLGFSQADKEIGGDHGSARPEVTGLP